MTFMRPGVRTAAVLAAALALLVVATELRAEDAAGQRLYLKYCGACHGLEGKGDGVVSQLMRPQPTDLTQIAKQNKGEFPLLQIAKIIDGRESRRAHGDPDMPVWGELLKSEMGDPMGAEAATKGIVLQISEYLRSIQAN